ncbi:MAG TPA: M15 family metallopeptidase [bacterium]|jgi:D-alanyl-D-alanine dipeptidase|nr:M15 family metallopeptidase [bacterium]
MTTCGRFCISTDFSWKLLAWSVCLVILLWSLPRLAFATPPPGPGWVNVRTIPGVKVDLRYATANNFVGVTIYPTADCYIRQIGADKLKFAAQALQVAHPGWRIVVFDALRPRSAQWILWRKVEGTPLEKYVADPHEGSIHNYGFAVDLSLLDARGKEIDMGTPFDSFDPLAQPRLENEFVKNGRLSKVAHANREYLRALMRRAGFRGIPIEWWHFEALPRSQARSYPVVE